MSAGPAAAPRLQGIPNHVVSLGDHEALARQGLDPAVRAWFEGAAADGITLASNCQAWSRIRLLPRVLQDLSGSDTRVELFGRTFPCPLLVAPVAFQRLVHPDGEVATAVAASVQGVGFVASTQASVRIETIARAVAGDADRGPLWFQLYWQADRGLNERLVRRAEAAGYEALVLTVDAPVTGLREAQRRAGFTVPAGMAVNLPDADQGGGTPLAQLRAAAPTWPDVEWLRARTRLPLILKGILHPDDARQAASLGVDGIIVSNHGGRTLDTLPATADVLPAVVAAAGCGMAVLVDGGIRRGTDVLKALALGARAVLVGRPVIWGLANAGAAGAAHVLRLLRDELDVAMALTGTARLDGIAPSLLMPPR